MWKLVNSAHKLRKAVLFNAQSLFEAGLRWRCPRRAKTSNRSTVHFDSVQRPFVIVVFVIIVHLASIFPRRRHHREVGQACAPGHSQVHRRHVLQLHEGLETVGGALLDDTQVLHHVGLGDALVPDHALFVVVQAAIGPEASEDALNACSELRHRAACLFEARLVLGSFRLGLRDLVSKRPQGFLSRCIGTSA